MFEQFAYSFAKFSNHSEIFQTGKRSIKRQEGAGSKYISISATDIKSSVWRKISNK